MHLFEVDRKQILHSATDQRPWEERIGAGEIWESLLQRHAQAPFHVLLGAGGLIDGDAVFKVCRCRRRTLTAWRLPE